MIDGRAGELSCKVTFNLDNGETFTLNSNDEINKNNYLTVIKLDENLSAQNNIPVGVNTSNVLDIELVSNNKALIPDNESSIYYGYMNNTAIIELVVTEDDTDVYFGKYYVNSWKSNISSTTPNKVVIQANCLMGIISKQEVPDVNINSGMYIKDYLIALIIELNRKLSDKQQIKYNEEDINFNTFPTMQFCNLDIENMGNCLNELSQCTLTNIYTDRNENLKTDYCCDDTKEEAKYRLDVLTSAECGTGVLVDYDGVKVKYSLGNIKDVESLASLHEQDVKKGDTEFKDISLGNSVYKINRIECVAEDANVFVAIKSAKYNKRKMSLVIESDAVTKVNITIYGQRLDDTELTKESGGNNLLEINNKVLTPNYIDKYMQNMLTLITIKNNSMQVEGYFKPQIKLGDIIFVNVQGAMNVSGYYKIVGLSWDFGMYGKCIISLIKTFTLDYDINVITNNLNELLENRLNGINSVRSQYISLSEEENTVVEDKLYTQLYDLRKLLYGGV